MHGCYGATLSWSSKGNFPGEPAPEKQEIGSWTGNFDFRIKFPTRTKNLRKVPAEWAQEGPLSGPLSVLTFGCGFNGVASAASPGTYQWAKITPFLTPRV